MRRKDPISTLMSQHHNGATLGDLTESCTYRAYRPCCQVVTAGRRLSCRERERFLVLGQLDVFPSKTNYNY